MAENKTPLSHFGCCFFPPAPSVKGSFLWNFAFLAPDSVEGLVNVSISRPSLT